MTDYLCTSCYVGGFAVAWVLLSAFFHKFVRRSGAIVARAFPNGMMLHCIGGDAGTQFVYKEIFMDRAYFKHGISLDGIAAPVVIDAGANIGLFSLFIAQQFPTAKVYGAEPVPLLHEAASRNTAPFKDRVQLFRGGLGKAPGTAAFSIDPGFSAGSSMHREVIEEEAFRSGIFAIVRASVLDFGLVGTLPKPVANAVAAILGVPVLNIAFVILILPLLVLFVLFELPRPKKIAVTCDVVTVPALLQRFGAANAHIDFLKVDVEGAEWDVLLGIDDATWARIDQVIVEVHNLEGGTRLETVKALLRSKGFASVVQDEEEFEIHKIMDMGTLFARKQAPAAATAGDEKKPAAAKRAPSTPRKGKKTE